MVLYSNFKKPSHANDSKLTDDVIIRDEKGEIIGFTRPKCKQKKERKKIWTRRIKGRIWLRAFGTMPKYLFGNFRYGRNVIHLFV